MISATEALQRLREGNRRFARGLSEQDPLKLQARRLELARSQAPFAVILGCSDSRVPAEIVFDQGLGDLFVIRVAGNIVARSQIGSVEFAAERFKTKLVVVLGHSACGAVEATLEQLERPADDRSPNLRAIVERIRPNVESLAKSWPGRDPAALLREAVRAHVRASVFELKRSSKLLERLSMAGDLDVVGAEYSLDTGAVEFFEGR